MDTAIALLNSAIVLNPNNADAHQMVGTMHGYLGHVGKALEHQRHAERLNPLDSGPAVNMGYAIAHFGVRVSCRNDIMPPVAL
jgi:Flp pilus assembly protein TadD